MIEKSIFTNDEIKKIINLEYGLKINKVKQLKKGSNNLFLIYSKKKKYILKEFQSKFTKEALIQEYNLICNLHNINTYEYLITKNNSCYFCHKNKLCICIKYIKGKEYKNNTLTLNKIKHIANVHAQIEKNLTNLDKSKLSFLTFCNKDKINKNLAFMNDFINKEYLDNLSNRIKKDYIKKINIINKLNLNENFEKLKDISCKSCHGDFSIQQLIFSKKKTFVLDFSLKYLPISWEVIRSYSYCDKKCKNGIINLDNLIAYTKEFIKIYPLEKSEICFMPLIYLLQLLSSNFGYKQYIENKDINLLKFAYFRTKLCENLYNNLQLYQNALNNIF